MKKIIPILALVGMLCPASAQTTFTAADYPSVGDADSMKYQIVLTDSFLATETSDHYTWDYSNLAFMSGAAGIYYEYLAPNPGDYTGFPTGADLEERCITIPINNLYQKSNDTLFLMRLGTATTSGSVAIPKVPWLTFPLAFGDSGSVTLTQFVDVAQTTAGSKRTHTYKYDGFGTVKLPWGNFGSLMRIKMITRDSSLVLGSVATYTDYYWFRQGGGVPILHLASTNFAEGSNPTYTALANKTASAATGIAQVGQTNINLYPNPTDGKVNIDLPNGVVSTITVLDLTGKKLLEQVANQTMAIDLSRYSNGLYLIKITDQNGKLLATDKISLQHN